MKAHTTHRRLARMALPVVAAIIIALFAALEWATEAAFAHGISTWGAATGVLLSSLLWAALAGLERTRSPLAQAACAALARSMEMALCALFLFVLVAAASFLPVSLSSRFMLGDRATDTIIYFALGLGLILAVQASLGAVAQRRLDHARTRAELAERDRLLLQAEMALLRAQIEPHFLWNTLAHVQYLARKEPEAAAAMTGNLITYLRAAVPGARGDASTLGSEMASVRAYLAIMQIRMGARLHAEVGFPEHLADLPFAPLILQTLVENAIKHGVEPKPGPVAVMVSAEYDPDHGRCLLLRVGDTGAGLADSGALASTASGTGLGLASVRERLHGLYGERASLRLAARPGGGVDATLAIFL
ncbi:MAG: histidine kinase [Massilia sp.]|uniref:sensor histidine kinase n=1 Tax=Massilia sp. TaxID=1882437 RepID=UPI002FCB832A